MCQPEREGERSTRARDGLLRLVIAHAPATFGVLYAAALVRGPAVRIVANIEARQAQALVWGWQAREPHVEAGENATHSEDRIPQADGWVVAKRAGKGGFWQGHPAVSCRVRPIAGRNSRGGGTKGDI